MGKLIPWDWIHSVPSFFYLAGEKFQTMDKNLLIDSITFLLLCYSFVSYLFAYLQALLKNRK